MISSSCASGGSIDCGKDCFFSCAIGHNLDGNSSVQCLASGSFSQPVPTCESKLEACMCPQLNLSQFRSEKSVLSQMCVFKRRSFKRKLSEHCESFSINWRGSCDFRQVT